MIETMLAGLNVLNKDVYYSYSVIIYIKSLVPIKCTYLILSVSVVGMYSFYNLRDISC